MPAYMQKYSTTGRDEVLPNMKAETFVKDVSAARRHGSPSNAVTGVSGVEYRRDREGECNYWGRCSCFTVEGDIKLTLLKRL